MPARLTTGRRGGGGGSPTSSSGALSKTGRLLAEAARSRGDRHAALGRDLAAEHRTRPSFEAEFAAGLDTALTAAETADTAAAFGGFCGFVAAFLAGAPDEGHGLLYTTLRGLAAAAARPREDEAAHRKLCQLMATVLDATAAALESIEEELWDELVSGLLGLTRHTGPDVRAAAVLALAFFQCPGDDAVRPSAIPLLRAAPRSGRPAPCLPDRSAALKSSRTGRPSQTRPATGSPR